MSKVSKTISEIHNMHEIASRDQWVNSIHPLVKFILTVFFIAVVVSFNKYNFIGLLGMGVYLIAGFILAELSLKECLWRLRIVLPIVCIAGLANPFLDRSLVLVAGIPVRAGVISMITLLIKGCFAVMASYIFIATTTVEKICYALSLLHLPRIMITQFLLTFRYLTVLLNEINRMTQAYSLRAPNQKGINIRVWGSFVGQLLLRSMDRAGNVYESMILRGYNGDFHYFQGKIKCTSGDILYLLIWAGLFVLLRHVPIILIFGNLIGRFF